MMFEKFIFGTDLSPATSAVARCVGSLKQLGAKNCLLVHCVSTQQGAAMAFSYKPPEAFTAELQMQEQILAELGFAVESRTEFGSPKVRLTDIATHEGFSLIVIGTQERSLLAEFVLGGVAYGVITRARTPVLLLPVKSVPGDEHECESIGWCDFNKHVLIATDFSDTSDRAFSVVEEMIPTGVTQITLIHIQDQDAFADISDSKREDYSRLDRDRLEQLRTRLQSHGCEKASIELPLGHPKDGIVHFANGADVSMIVMGTQGRGFLGQLTVGSVAGNTVRQAKCPVLLIPPR